MSEDPRIMDTLQLIVLAGTTLVGVLAGALGCHWHMSRVASQLHQRLERSEQARNGAIERSAQAREQIAQLNRAITELRRSHSSRASQEASREQVEKLLTDGDTEKTLVLPRGEPLQAFADTQPMT